MSDSSTVRNLPCLHMPAKGDPYFNTKASGGYSPCALGNPAKRVEGLNVLPNCVGYAVGAFNAVGGYGRIKWLAARGDACDFVKIAHAQGLEVAQEPTPGGVMVWSGGKGGFGHVAFVEGKATNSDGFVCSESEYYGKAWALYTRKPGTDGQWRDGCYWMDNSYHYEGCIKNPVIKEVDEMSKEEIREIIVETMKEEIPGMIREYLKDLGKLPASWWAKGAIKRVRESKIMVGDPATPEYPEGNFRPQALMTREEAAAIINSFLPDR